MNRTPIGDVIADLLVNYKSEVIPDYKETRFDYGAFRLDIGDYTSFATLNRIAVRKKTLFGGSRLERLENDTSVYLYEEDYPEVTKLMKDIRDGKESSLLAKKQVKENELLEKLIALRSMATKK